MLSGRVRQRAVTELAGNGRVRRPPSVVNRNAHRLHEFAGSRFLADEHGLPPHRLVVVDPPHQPTELTTD